KLAAGDGVDARWNLSARHSAAARVAPSQPARSARARRLVSGLRSPRLARVTTPSPSGGKRPKLMFIGWKLCASAPPVIWARRAPSAVVGGGALASPPLLSAAAKRPASRPIAALST